MKKSWSITVNGTPHTIQYQTGWKLRVTVDGQETRLKSQNWVLNMVDHPIPIEGADVRLVVIGAKVDLAVNGVYQNSGKPYEPLAKIPDYVNIFMVISGFGGLFLSGAIGMLVGLLFSLLYIKLAMNGKFKAVIGAFIGWIAAEGLLFLLTLNLFQ